MTKKTKTKSTQNAKILSYLNKNPGSTTLTVEQARNRFGIANPRARFFELREDGHPIVTEMRRGKDGVSRGYYMLNGETSR